MKSFKSFSTEEPKLGEEIGSYTDKDGYTIKIHHGVKPGEEYLNVHGENMRKGTMIRHHPNGSKVQGGYFMDWSEDPEESHAHYMKTPIRERARAEAERQGTKYDSLKNEFEFHKQNAKRYKQ